MYTHTPDRADGEQGAAIRKLEMEFIQVAGLP